MLYLTFLSPEIERVQYDTFTYNKDVNNSGVVGRVVCTTMGNDEVVDDVLPAASLKLA